LKLFLRQANFVFYNNNNNNDDDDDDDLALLRGSGK